MPNAPLIITERLTLHQPEIADVWVMMDIVSHPQTSRFLGRANSPADHFTRFQRNAGSWFLHGYGSFIVRLKGSDEPIGNCGVFHSFRGLGEDFDNQPEAGWIVRHDQAGRGIAAEALTAALQWFEATHGARRIVAMIAPENEPSQRLAAKLGFTPMRDTALPDGEAVRLFERAATDAGA